MASPSSARAGFFDLPLELRQQIYRDCLPRSGGNGDYIATLNEDPQPLQSLRDADPRIASELQDEQRMTLQRLTFNVTTTEWNPPTVAIAYPNLKEVYIEIDLYPFFEDPSKDELIGNCIVGEGCTESRQGKYLETLRSNLSRFVQWFKRANDRKLDCLWVEFKDLKDCDHRLCEVQFDNFGSIVGHTLRTRPGKDIKEDFTIFEYLVMPLEDFPPVEQPFLPDLDGIFEYTYLIDNGIKCMYDWFYQNIIIGTLRSWLEGGRDFSLRQRLMSELRGHWERVEEEWQVHLEVGEDDDGYDSEGSLIR